MKLQRGEAVDISIEEARLKAHLVVLSTDQLWGGISCLTTEAA